MSGLDNLNSRLNYRGGVKQQDRMINGKLASLKRALLYSYQAATAILADGREFRCLINPDKLKVDYEDKIISIPFEDICLNNRDKETKGKVEEIGMKPGDVFTWKETDTEWLVYLQRLEEKAYFRAEIRKCDYTLDINGKEYKFYARKKPLSEIPWHTAKGVSWNDLNYALELYITKTEDTQNYFNKFKIIKVGEQPWEVQSIDAFSTEGIIRVLLKEYYNNTIAEEIEIEKENKQEEDKVVINKGTPQIEGPTTVYPYDEIEYKIKNAEGGVWKLNSTKAVINNQTDTAVLITITTGRSGEFELIYKRENEDDITINIVIESL